MFILEDYYMANCPIQIPGIVGTLVSLVYTAIRIGIPVILLIVGMVDLGKAVVAQKDDEIKKAQGLLVKKIIAALLVFLLFTLIKFAINLVDKDTASMWTCVDSILGNTQQTGTEWSNSDIAAKQAACTKAGKSWNTTTNTCA